MMAGERPQAEMTIPAEVLTAISDEIARAIELSGAPPEATAEAAAFKALPLADIHQVIVRTDGSTVVVSKSSPPVTTDARGRFAFNDVRPGTYKLMFAGSGYAKQDYGQRAIGAGGVPMTLAPGQAKTDIVMRMAAVGALSGRIRDTAGQPAVGIPVQLFRFAYDETGQRKAQRVTATKTDDRGEYRMYYLSPGRYYMSAGNQPGTNPQAGSPSGLEALFFGTGYSTANRIPQNYALAYYPGVADENSAVAIDVQSGADLRGIDLFVSAQQSYRVRGRVLDPGTGRPPQTAGITIVPQNADLLLSGGLSFGSPNYRAADGTFEFQNVSAGTYTISVSLPNPPQTRPLDLNSMSPADRNAYLQAMQDAELARPKASATVNVVNTDVDGIILMLGVSSSISARVRAESNAPNAGPFDFIRVELRGNASAGTDPLNGGPQSRPVAPDGSFRIDNVWPGEYRVAVGGLPSGLYVKEARLGSADVLNTPLRVTGPDSNTLDILLSPNVATIDGAVVDVSGQPMPGAQVVLIPKGNRERTELFRPVTADLSGRFAIPSVAPGEYTLAAWDVIEPNAFFHPDFIRQAEANGRAVRILESSSQTVNVTAVPLSR
jgi:5-hydroxyisourate hydrolase-like protein (transthyretin family)